MIYEKKKDCEYLMTTTILTGDCLESMRDMPSGKSAVICELNPEYSEIAQSRLDNENQLEMVI